MLSARFTVIFVEENGRYPSSDYIEKLAKSWFGIGTHGAGMLLRELEDIEQNGPRGYTEILNGVTLYFAIVGAHCIAHAQNPAAQDEIIVPAIFHMQDYANGRLEAWRLLNKVVVFIP
jgi:hypothetical protein